MCVCSGTKYQINSRLIEVESTGSQMRSGSRIEELFAFWAQDVGFTKIYIASYDLFEV